MNIINYWKELVANCHSYEDFVSSEEFIKKLNENVPDWKQQVKDKNLWPDLHSYTWNIGESSYTSAIIAEAGLEFAFYLIQKGGGNLDDVLALDFCCKHLNLWNSFPCNIKEKVLDFRLRNFLRECQQNIIIWQSLTEGEKNRIFDNLATEEENYILDLLLFRLWADKLNYEESPYIKFKTDHFRHVEREITHRKERDNRFFDDRINHMIERWEIPGIDLQHHNYLSYTPSRKLQLLKEVAESCNDQQSITTLDNIVNKIKYILH